jgi:hypothetical protein
MYYIDPILAEVQERKAHIVEKYGGIEGLHKHMDEDRPRLEREGWHFVDTEAYFESIKGSRSIFQDIEDEVDAFIAQEDAQRAAMA